MTTVISFLAFTGFVAAYAWYKLRKEKLDSQDGYFLGGRSLTGIVIAGSMLLTLLFSVAAFSCFFVVLLHQSIRIKNINTQIREMGKDLDEKEMVDG